MSRALTWIFAAIVVLATFAGARAQERACETCREVDRVLAAARCAACAKAPAACKACAAKAKGLAGCDACARVPCKACVAAITGAPCKFCAAKKVVTSRLERCKLCAKAKEPCAKCAERRSPVAAVRCATCDAPAAKPGAKPEPPKPGPPPSVVALQERLKELHGVKPEKNGRDAIIVVGVSGDPELAVIDALIAAYRAQGFIVHVAATSAARDDVKAFIAQVGARYATARDVKPTMALFHHFGHGGGGVGVFVQPPGGKSIYVGTHEDVGAWMGLAFNYPSMVEVHGFFDACSQGNALTSYGPFVKKALSKASVRGLVGAASQKTQVGTGAYTKAFASALAAARSQPTTAIPALQAAHDAGADAVRKSKASPNPDPDSKPY